MLNIVLDANILVSAFLTPEGRERPRPATGSKSETLPVAFYFI